MKKENGKRLGSSLALFAAALIWGSSFVTMKSTVETFPPNILLAIRFTFAFIVLSLVFIKKWRLFSKAYLWRGALVGACLFLGYYFQTVGLTDTTPGKNAFLTATYCVIVPFLYWAVDKTRPDGYNIAAAVLCIAGIGLISLDGDFSIRYGDAMTLVCGIFYAIQIVAVAKFAAAKYDVMLLTVIEFGTAAVLAWAAGLSFETFPSQVGAEAIWGMAYLAVFATTIAMFLQNVGLIHTHPAVAAVLLSLESVFGVAFSVVLYGEELTLRLILGFVLVFAAVIVSETKLSFLHRKEPKISDFERLD